MSTGAVHIVGAPRSGTSLVFKLLCLHPDAGWLSNLARRSRWRPEANAGNRLAALAPTRRRAVWFRGGNAYVYGDRRRWHERAFPMPVEGQPLFDALLGPPDETPSAGGIAAIGSVLDRSRRWAGGQRMICKNVANNRRIAALATADPSVRVVHVVRDGRAVARSLRQVDWWPAEHLWWYGGTVSDWHAAGHDPWEACVRSWVAEVDELDRQLATIDPARVHTVRYEELARDPAGEVARLVAFTGLADQLAHRAEVAQLEVLDRDDRWRTELDPVELGVLNDLAGAALDRLGYDPTPATPAPPVGITS